MILKEINGVKIFVFENFEKTGLVRHCFSTKIGGVSSDCYSSMNLGFNRGDEYENVIKNYELISEAVGFDYRNCVLGTQCHLTNVANIDEKHIGMGITRENTLEKIDGLVTNKKNIVLTTFYADCVPLYFLDPVKKVISVSHSGWQGTLENMAKNTIHNMIENYDCNPEDILAGIGPSIGDKCFEVESDVVDEFYRLHDCLNYIEDKGEGKYSIDLWSINKHFMIECGLNEKNIEMSNICTKCNKDLFFSHRISGADRGTMAGFIELI